MRFKVSPFIKAIVFVMIIVFNNTSFAKEEITESDNINHQQNHRQKANFDYSYIAKIPILHEGRVKPLDSFARHYMKRFNKGRILNDISIEQWLVGVIFQEKSELNRKIFNIGNPEVVNALGLKWWKKHRYSYEEISASFLKNTELIRKIVISDRKNLSIAENQLLDIYFAHQDFTDLLGSISLLFPLNIHNKYIIDDIQTKKKYIRYQDIKEYISAKKETIVNILNDNISSENINAKDRELINLVYFLKHIEQDKFSHLLKIIPPPWKEDKDLWFSPWEILEKGRSNIETGEIFDLWTGLLIAYRENKSQEFFDISEQIYNKSIILAGYNFIGSNMKNSNLYIEVFYNRFDPFYKSLILYIIAFIFLLFSNLLSSKILLKITEIIFYISFLIQALGLSLRVYIMQRPPVTNLYESILFVGFVIVFYSAIIVLKKDKYLGLFAGLISGIILLFVAKGYEANGDTMGMLVAVLDTNFWLATHVMTITIGYGCSFIAGLLAHFYLVNKIVNYKNIGSKKLEKTLLDKLKSSILVALFFTVLGTILGGIWADQSWGRFWGWDPKENGAMLLSLWLIWIIHGRFSGHFKDYSFVVAASFTNIIVVISWFGVNLLNVGLHSYGFTDSMASNIVIFGLIEIIFIIFCVVCYKKNIHFNICQSLLKNTALLKNPTKKSNSALSTKGGGNA